MFSDIVLFDDLKQLSRARKRLGISCFIIAKEFKSIEELQELKEKAGNIKNFRTCMLVKQANEKTIKKFFAKADFIAVFGGNVSKNKFAVSSKQVDFLIAPCTIEKASIDTAIMRIAKENNVSIVFPFREFAIATEFQQSQLLKHYLLVAKLCKRFMVKLLVFSLAKNERELKTKKELMDLGKAIGFSAEQLESWHEEV